MAKCQTSGMKQDFEKLQIAAWCKFALSECFVVSSLFHYLQKTTVFMVSVFSALINLGTQNEAQNTKTGQTVHQTAAIQRTKITSHLLSRNSHMDIYNDVTFRLLSLILSSHSGSYTAYSYYRYNLCPGMLILLVSMSRLIGRHLQTHDKAYRSI